MTQKEARELIAQLHSKYYNILLKMAYRRLGDPGLAEDIVQQAFVTAVIKCEKLATYHDPLGWFYITIRKMATREKEKAYHNDISIEDNPEVLNKNYAEMEDPLEFSMPSSLSEDEKKWITLVYGAQVSYKDLAEKYGMSEAACRQRTARIMRKIREAEEKDRHKIHSLPDYKNRR